MQARSRFWVARLLRRLASLSLWLAMTANSCSRAAMAASLRFWPLRSVTTRPSAPGRPSVTSGLTDR